MGLDVRTYGNIKLIGNNTDNINTDNNVDFIAYVIDDEWKYKIKNLEYGRGYSGDVIFRGVSYPYSTHNRFRERLIKLIGRDDLLDDTGDRIKWNELPTEIPFHDLINFADNEGCLDWEVSSIIYSDFEKYNEKAKSEMGEYYYEKYKIWLETFKSAAHNKGVVVFS